MLPPNVALDNAKRLVSLFENRPVGCRHFEIDEFECIGTGCSRVAYRLGDYVYKLEYSFRHDFPRSHMIIAKETWANVAEHQQALRIAAIALPEIWVVPETLVVHAGTPVLVMPYVDGVSLDDIQWDVARDYVDACTELNRRLGMCDIFAQNVIMSQGRLHMIDMGEYV